MDINLADGSHGVVDIDALTVTFDGEPARALTDEEIALWGTQAQAQAPVEDKALPFHMESALELLRGYVEDNMITDEELSAARPIVMGALIRFSSIGEWDNSLGLEAVRILARVCQAILIRADAQSTAAKSALQSHTQALQLQGASLRALSEQITALSARTTTLEGGN